MQTTHNGLIYDTDKAMLVATFVPGQTCWVTMPQDFHIETDTAEKLYVTHKLNWMLLHESEPAELVPIVPEHAADWLLFHGRTEEYDMYFGIENA